MIPNVDLSVQHTDIEHILRGIYHRLRRSSAAAYEPSADTFATVAASSRFENLDLPPQLYAQLDYAARIYDPRSVPGNTRFYRVKSFIMRVLRLYTTRQVEFNATVLRLLDLIVDKLGDIVQIFQYFRDAEVRLTRRLEAAEQRVAALNERLDSQRARIEALEAYEREVLAQRRRFEAIEEVDRITDKRLRVVEDLHNRLEYALTENAALRRRLDNVVARLSDAGVQRAPVIVERRMEVSVGGGEVNNDHLYFPYLNLDRGTEEEIRKRVGQYLSLFQSGDASEEMEGVVLDIGCGRGEFLEACVAAGIPCRGVDVNEDMVGYCREKGLDVVHARANQYLKGLEDETLRGIVSCHVIEHLQAGELLEFVRLSHAKVRSGGHIVIETPNPTSVFALQLFYRDFTHVRPVHPDTLEFLYKQLGVRHTELRWVSPVPEQHLLKLCKQKCVDEAFERLNNFLFGYLDYALIVTK
ncbi:MAG: methyltransferase domain-containing protein [bacterium]|nr:methyltransferase domain-containing protein [bacterium]